MRVLGPVSGKKCKGEGQSYLPASAVFSFMLRYSVCQGLHFGVLNPIRIVRLIASM